MAEHPAGGIRVGTIAGSGVYVMPSWFVIAGLIAFLAAPVIDEVEPGLGVWKYVAGLAFAVLLYGSILLHEAAHAVTAKRLGYDVGPIVLHLLGGATAIEGDSRRPRDEFLIAASGPVVSLLIGGVAAAALLLHPVGLIWFAISGVATTNLLVGVFNLLPGLPLDGGRALRAAVWGITRNPHRATVVAAWGGRVVAGAVLLWALGGSRLFGVTPSPFGMVFSGLIAFTLWQAASASMVSGRVQGRLPDIPIRDLTRRTLTVPTDLPLGEAVRRAREEQAGSIVTVSSDGRPVGLVHEAALMAVPEERRPWVATSTVAVSITPGLTIGADTSFADLIRVMQREKATEYLAVEPDGTICGVVSAFDVDAAFRRAAQ